MLNLIKNKQTKKSIRYLIYHRIIGKQILDFDEEIA